MKRTVSQEVMDAARGDPEGRRRSAAWERYSAFREETNARGWPPPEPIDPNCVVLSERVFVPTFPIADIRPWVFLSSVSAADMVYLETSTVSVPADHGPNTKRKD